MFGWVLGSVGEGSISVIMVGITVPLCLMDMVLAVVSVKHDVWQAAAVAVTVMQKLIQVGVYHFSIRHKVRNLASSFLPRLIGEKKSKSDFRTRLAE